MSPSLFVKQEKVTLLINIGSGAVSAGLVSFGIGKKPTVIYSVHLPFKIEKNPEKNKLAKEMDLLLGQTLALVVKNGMNLPFWKGKNKHIHSALVSFSSPWFIPKVKKIELKKERFFIINHEFFNSILESEKSVFIKESLSEESTDDDFVVIESSFSNFRVNGYSTTNIFGQKTKNFDASLYMSAVSKPVYDVVHKQLLKFFSIKTDDVSMRAFPFISFAVIKKLFPTVHNFLFMDITAEMTDVVLVFEKSISEIVSFPSGRNFIIRQISKKLDVPFEVAESSLRIYNSKKTNDDTAKQIKEVLSEAEKEWSIYFENSFTELSKDVTLPQVMYLTAGSDVIDIYSNFIKTPENDQSSEFRKNVQVFPLDTASMSHMYNADKKFAPNIFLSFLTVFSSFF